MSIVAIVRNADKIEDLSDVWHSGSTIEFGYNTIPMMYLLQRYSVTMLFF